ncbi:hypothetical protein D3C87_1805250 [compost metagenome]
MEQKLADEHAMIHSAVVTLINLDKRIFNNSDVRVDGGSALEAPIHQSLISNLGLLAERPRLPALNSSARHPSTVVRLQVVQGRCRGFRLDHLRYQITAISTAGAER